MAPLIMRGQTLFPSQLAQRQGSLAASMERCGLLPPKAPARLAVDDASGDQLTNRGSHDRLINRVRPDGMRRLGQDRPSPR
jgi:hypothetical protein